MPRTSTTPTEGDRLELARRLTGTSPIRVERTTYILQEANFRSSVQVLINDCKRTVEEVEVPTRLLRRSGIRSSDRYVDHVVLEFTGGAVVSYYERKDLKYEDLNAAARRFLSSERSGQTHRAKRKKI